jgi:mannose-6-phosphate isomerase class I
VFIDLTREEALKRNSLWVSKKSKTQSISPRRIYYVDFPLHESHRKKTFSRIDYYIDGNDLQNPKMLSRDCFCTLVECLLKNPVRCKPLYEPGVWGGQWLKRHRNLPGSMDNCAYGFELLGPEQSVLVECGTATLDIPFNLLMETHGRIIMGKKAQRRFGDFFPIRFAYDDTWEGGNLSLQAHPTAHYARTRFNEPEGQAEMYYIFACMPGTINHLGLKEGVRRRDFIQAVKESESSRTQIEYARYVNIIPAMKGEILLIPPGTLHGAGANELVLEISSTPYRYTFKIYDYCRPDIDGSYRPIHIKHAFKVLKFFRKQRWVARNLKPEPKLFAIGKSGGACWDEYTIADRREFSYIVRRIEFESRYEDDTNGGFHILNLVEGESVTVRAKSGGLVDMKMAFSETVLVPSAVGPYEVQNDTGVPCKVVKSLLRQ